MIGTVATAQAEGLDRLADLKPAAEDLAAEAGENGLFGLADVGMFLGEQLAHFEHTSPTDLQRGLNLMARLLALMAGYLAGTSADGAAALAACLASREWPQPLQEGDAAVLRSMLEADAPNAAAGDESGTPSSEPLVREIVRILQTELQALARMGPAVRRQLQAQVDSAHGPGGDAVAAYIAQLERFRAVVGNVELHALGEVVAHVLDNVQRAVAGDKAAKAIDGLLLDWPEHASGYLDELGRDGAGASLLEFMARPAWPSPMPPDVRKRLSAGLAAVTVTDSEPTGPLPLRLAAEDLSLQLPEDIVPALLDALLQELPEQCERFEAAVQSMVDGTATMESLRTAQRVAHTIKGAANTVGVRGVANFTHHLEDLLIAYVDSGRVPAPPSAKKLLRASDCLQQMSDCLLGRDVEPDDAYEVLLGALRDFDPAASAAADAITSAAPPGQVSARPAATGDTGEAESAEQLRIPAQLVDELYRLAGESIIHTAQVRERFQRIQQSLRGLGEQYALIQELAVELDEKVGRQERRPREAAKSGRDFDPLEMDQFHELQSMANRLQEIAQDNQAFRQALQRQCTDLTDLVLAQERLHAEQSELVGRCRMLRVAELVPRLQRAVRQACRLTGKQVEFIVQGTATLVDSYVLHALADPLMHVLRNAVDHGIESADTRAASGKSSTGTLRLGFARIGNDIVVHCEDDGAGLDYAAIESVARSRGLLDDTQSPSEEQLKAALMQPGFSTRVETTLTSGRGIGMAAVAARVGELKGTVSVSSTAGFGCIVEMKIPVSLISVAGVLVSVRGRTVAITNRGIEHMAGRIAAGGASCRIDGRDYSAIVLADSLYGPAGEGEKQPYCAALVVGEGPRSGAVLVDEIIETRNFVVKGLGDYVPYAHGLLGATLLGDGAVVPVLDLLDWMSAPVPEMTMADADPHLTTFPSRRRILIVDDSISTRRSLSQLLEDGGYEPVTATDGIDALDRMAAASPDLLLVDLEMPRMNGLELTRHLRAAESGAELPIVMVTSRSTDKHRREAREAGVDIYLTKPYSEDSLLEAVEALLTDRDAAAGRR